MNQKFQEKSLKEVSEDFDKINIEVPYTKQIDITDFKMTRIWDDIKWIFELDGSLRDIYVQDVTLSDWETLIDFLNT